MKHLATLLTLSLLTAAPALAQLDRTAGDAADVVWARDIGSATITVDGTLDEPEWDQAESITFQWDDKLGFPGSGQFFQDGQNPNDFEDPLDPVDATVSFLRRGNDLIIGVQARDKSIGGQPGLWNFDGLFMTLIDKNDRADDFSMIDDYFASTREEFAFSWWTRGQGIDTTATGDPLPGIAPLFYIQTSQTYQAYAQEDSTALGFEGAEFAYTIDGVANDDFNGGSTATDDVGYTLEFVIPVDSLGWDLTGEMSRMPLSMAIQDADYNWPRDDSRYSTHRVFWQGQWLNTFTGGDSAPAYVAGDPSVTVSSGATPAYSMPEFTVPSAANEAEPTVDGVLDEAAWAGVDPQFTLKYQATEEELDAGLPGVLSPYYSFYFHPDDNTVLDPTEGRVHMFYRGSTLYLGLDTDDQAINGQSGESGRDGFRLILRSRDSTNSNLQAENIAFDFSVDSTGTVRYDQLPGEVEAGTDVRAAVSLKGGSTAADPSDIDDGYQIEVALDLEAIGYGDVGSDGARIWASVTFFDSDALQDDSQSYTTRTWSMGERSNGASIMGYLDPNTLVGTPTEGGPDADGFRSLGNAPNPFRAQTAVRYELPRAADVTVEVYDVLGRLVRRVEAGLQAAGPQQAVVEAIGLSSGSYVYRVRLDDGSSVTGRMLVVR